MVTNRPGREIFARTRLRPVQHIGWIGSRFLQRAQNARVADIISRGGTFPATSASTSSPGAIFEGDEIVPVATTARAGTLKPETATQECKESL